jgi:hypothetical protein
MAAQETDLLYVRYQSNASTKYRPYDINHVPVPEYRQYDINYVLVPEQSTSYPCGVRNWGALYLSYCIIRLSLF